MIVRNPDGTITSIEQKIDHRPYPCPPSGDPSISCEDAWRRYAQANGVKIVSSKE